MSAVKSAAEGHLCQSRCLSAAPHTSLFNPTHFKYLVEAGLFLSHWLCDAKEMNNAPKILDYRAWSMWSLVLQVMQPKGKQIPKVKHIYSLQCPAFGDSAIHFAGERDAETKWMLRPRASLCCKQVQRSPCWMRSEPVPHGPTTPVQQLCRQYAWYCAWSNQHCFVSLHFSLRFSVFRARQECSYAFHLLLQSFARRDLRTWYNILIWKSLTIICLSGSWLHLAGRLGIGLAVYFVG